MLHKWRLIEEFLFIYFDIFVFNMILMSKNLPELETLQS